MRKVAKSTVGELVLLSEQAQQLVDIREKQVGHDNPIRSSVAEVGVHQDDQIHQRAAELTASVCASIVVRTTGGSRIIRIPLE